MTKCQITCKSLQKSSKCQNFLRVWHLVIFRADQLKKPPCMCAKLTLVSFCFTFFSCTFPLAEFGQFLPILAQMCFSFAKARENLWGETLATFRDQSAMLGEHLSQKLTLAQLYNPKIWPKVQGCISCGILVSGIWARGVSSEHMENMEMFSCTPT